MNEIHICSPEGYKVQQAVDALGYYDIAPLEVADILTASKVAYPESTTNGITTCTPWRLEGHLVEVKIGDDFGMHTEPLERFQDECYRMACWRQKNPHVVCHAVWVIDWNDPEYITGNQTFYNICFKYHIWGHIKSCVDTFIHFLKSLEQPKAYQEFEPFIKRTHEEPTILAKMFRQFPRISSEMAIKLANLLEKHEMVNMRSWWMCDEYCGDYVLLIKDEIIDTIGRKKNGEPYKLATDLIRWLETGKND